MKVSRPKKVVTLAETQAQPTGWSGFFNQYGNSIATSLLVALAVILFFRWRMQSAERAHTEVAAELQIAQSQVESLRSGRFAAQGASSADTLKAIQQIQTQANSAIEQLIGNSDAGPQVRAQAFILRGDMYWYLANLPPLAGSDSEASLRLAESTDTLLTKSAESYGQVLHDSAYADQRQQLDAAHLGLAAIAENKGDWDTAKKEFQAVAADSTAEPVLADQANAQIAAIPELKQPIYIAPPSGIAATQPATATALPFGPVLPTTLPAKVQSLLPTTKPGH